MRRTPRDRGFCHGQTHGAVPQARASRPALEPARAPRRCERALDGCIREHIRHTADAHARRRHRFRRGPAAPLTRGRAGVAVRVAIVSTFPPRACGIGAFAADLRAALIATGSVEVAELVAVVHEPSSPQRRGVLATIAQAVRGDYVRTARMLGLRDVDVVLLQHEYGIFGGRDGEYVLSFAQELAQPLVVTLHTVLSEPTGHQADVLTQLCREAELVIVMTDTARRLLVASGACL